MFIFEIRLHNCAESESLALTSHAHDELEPDASTNSTTWRVLISPSVLQVNRNNNLKASCKPAVTGMFSCTQAMHDEIITSVQGTGQNTYLNNDVKKKSSRRFCTGKVRRWIRLRPRSSFFAIDPERGSLCAGWSLSCTGKL